MVAVEKNPNSFQYIGKSFKDDDDILEIAFQQNEGILRYASERLRKTNILRVKTTNIYKILFF